MNISINNIQFSYNGSPVLKDLSCHIKTGDFIAVVGPNGSGKSTFIKCLNGILKPQKGAVSIDKLNINTYKLSELAKSMAYVPQKTYSQVPVSVFDTVLTGRKPYFNWKPSHDDIHITSHIIKQLNLNDIALKDVNKLSGGQQQIVFIARALAQQPKILLLDEPTANLDIKHTMQIMDILYELSQNGITIIVALHDVNLAIKYASDIMMLKHGKIFAYGHKDIITEENLELLYDIKVQIVEKDKHLIIIPLGSLTRT